VSVRIVRRATHEPVKATGRRTRTSEVAVNQEVMEMCVSVCFVRFGWSSAGRPVRPADHRKYDDSMTKFILAPAHGEATSPTRFDT